MVAAGRHAHEQCNHSIAAYQLAVAAENRGTQGIKGRWLNSLDYQLYMPYRGETNESQSDYNPVETNI